MSSGMRQTPLRLSHGGRQIHWRKKDIFWECPQDGALQRQQLQSLLRPVVERNRPIPGIQVRCEAKTAFPLNGFTVKASRKPGGREAPVALQ